MNKKFYDFLKGRNGADDLAKICLYVSIVLLLLGSILNNLFLTYISLILILYANFRVFSRNLEKRIRENIRYKNILKKINNSLVKYRNRIFGKDGYKYFACSDCNKELRVPKNKGKLKVKCPNCQNIMEVKS